LGQLFLKYRKISDMSTDIILLIIQFFVILLLLLIMIKKPTKEEIMEDVDVSLGKKPVRKEVADTTSNINNISKTRIYEKTINRDQL